MGTEALNFHIACRREDGEMIPVPRGLDDLRSDPEFVVDFDGALVATAPVFTSGRRTQRVNVSFDGDLLGEIDAAAAASLPKRQRRKSPADAEL